MAVTSTNTSATAAPASSSSSAPANVAVDFMAMLGQLAGTAATTPAAAGVQAASVLPMSRDGEELEPDPESADQLGALPLSLPVMTTEAKAGAAGAQAAALSGVTTGTTGGVANSRADAVAPQAQLLSELLPPEQGAGEGKFEIPHLPATNENASPVRQAELAHARPVQHPVGTAEWADEIGSRMTMMVEQGRHTASLRLSPEHLGPLEVRITVDGDKASVQFGASHVDTRNALENALPRLREMFASQGLSLADANVSRESPRQQSNQAPASRSSGLGSVASDEGSANLAPTRVRLGLLDTYA